MTIFSDTHSHEYKEAKVAKVSMEFAINNPQIAQKRQTHLLAIQMLSFSVDKLFKWGSAAKDLWTIRGHFRLSLHAN